MWSISWVVYVPAVPTHTHTRWLVLPVHVCKSAIMLYCCSNQPKIPVLRLKKKGNDEMSIENATFEKQVCTYHYYHHHYYHHHYYHHHYYHPHYYHHHYYHPHCCCRMCQRMTVTVGCAMKEGRCYAVIAALVCSTYSAVD